MATITSYNALNLVELAKRSTPKGSFASIAEVLTKTNEILKDAPYVQANGDTVHKFTRRASLPTGSRRKLNFGVAAESSQTTEHWAGIAMFETYSQIDKRLLDISVDPQATRNSEAISFIEGLGQTFANEIFYGSKATNPTGFDGAATQLNSLSTANGYILGCGGTASAGSGDLTSVYIFDWGTDKVHLVYPKGSTTAGITHQDLGEVTDTEVVSSVTYYKQVVRDRFAIDGGLVIKDPRSVARLCNIESTIDLTGTFAGDNRYENNLDPRLLITLLNKMKNPKGAVIYCNVGVKTQFDLLAYDKANGFYTAQNIFGESITMFRGVPIKLCEAISNTEEQVS